MLYGVKQLIKNTIRDSHTTSLVTDFSNHVRIVELLDNSNTR